MFGCIGPFRLMNIATKPWAHQIADDRCASKVKEGLLFANKLTKIAAGAKRAWLRVPTHRCTVHRTWSVNFRNYRCEVGCTARGSGVRSSLAVKRILTIRTGDNTCIDSIFDLQSLYSDSIVRDRESTIATFSPNIIPTKIVFVLPLVRCCIFEFNNPTLFHTLNSNALPNSIIHFQEFIRAAFITHRGRAGCRYQQTLNGSFSAVPKPSSASKYWFESS